ncbi:hypothetical protein PT974_02444 [Cladobotryum mycophilum]|uniref:Zn(2)-C6 fungal-type domain-containing protein n=1 Tax=Cladobotryum mycophilum TaxID=491253 RepID=A0ABR0SY54_9HYPO
MVGVPGRSKGCITCRKRKKGCDKQEPSCLRCSRAGLACEGYGKDLIWLHTGAAGSSEQSSTSPSQLQQASADRPWFVRYERKKESNERIALSDNLVRSAREQLYLGFFWDVMTPSGRDASLDSLDLPAIGWIKVIPTFYNSEIAVRYVAIATAASMLGQSRKDAQLYSKGFQVYNWSIREMVKAIRQPERAKSDGLLVAARLMALYEILFGPGVKFEHSGWKGHIDGQVALLLARGSESCKTGIGHQLFVDIRTTTALVSIKKRWPSPFSSPEWKTIPWAVKEKSMHMKLMDTIEEVADLLVQIDTIHASPSDYAKKLQVQLLTRCLDAEASLSDWKSQIDLSTYDYTIAELPLPLPTTNADFSLLGMSCFYWATCLLLYSVSAFASKLDGWSTTPSSVSKADTTTYPFLGAEDISSSESESDWDVMYNGLTIYVKKIAHCIHLFFAPSSRVIHSGASLFPMSVALHFLEATEASSNPSEETKILRNIFQHSFMGRTFNRHRQADKQPIIKEAGDVRPRYKYLWV